MADHSARKYRDRAYGRRRPLKEPAVFLFNCQRRNPWSLFSNPNKLFLQDPKPSAANLIFHLRSLPEKSGRFLLEAGFARDMSVVFRARVITSFSMLMLKALLSREIRTGKSALS